jgi:hypothetical protein
MFVSYTGRQGSCILLYSMWGSLQNHPKIFTCSMCTCHQILIHVYILYTRSHNSPKIEHDLQRITTIGYKYIAQHQKKKTKKTQDVIIFIKLYILNQQKIVHVLLCVEKNGTIIIFLFGFLLSVVICCTICSIISQRYTPLFSAKKNI